MCYEYKQVPTENEKQIKIAESMTLQGWKAIVTGTNYVLLERDKIT